MEPPTTSTLASQIAAVFSNPTAPYPPPLDVLVASISAAAARGGRIFLYGVGREGLMIKGLCMRLAHLGLPTHMAFDMTTPPISAADLLVASAGPGGFSTVDALCSVARSSGAGVLVVTAQPETGSAVKYAGGGGGGVCYVAATTMGDGGGGAGEREVLPMGSLYEGALFVLFEMAVYKFWGRPLRLFDLDIQISNDCNCVSFRL